MINLSQDPRAGFHPEQMRLKPPFTETADELCGAGHALNALRKSILHPHQPGCAPDHALLYGPPCTGKTLLFRILASELEQAYPNTEDNPHHSAAFVLNCETPLSPFVGVAEKRIGLLLETVAAYEHSILLLDTVEKLFCTTVEAYNTSIQRCLIEGLEKLCSQRHALLICATTKPWLVWPGLLDHLSCKLLLDLPDEAAMEQWLQQNISACIQGTPQEKQSIIRSLLPRLRGAAFNDLNALSCLLLARSFDKQWASQPTERFILAPLSAQELEDAVGKLAISTDEEYLARLRDPQRWFPNRNGAYWR